MSFFQYTPSFEGGLLGLATVAPVLSSALPSRLRLSSFKEMSSFSTATLVAPLRTHSSIPMFHQR